MNIAIFAPTFLPTLHGAEIALYNIITGLSEHNDVNIYLFLPYYHKKLFDKSQIDVNCKVFSLPPKFISASFMNKRLASFYFKWFCVRPFKDLNIDIVLFHLFFPLSIGVVDYLADNNIPYVVAGRGEDIQMLPSIGYGYRLNKKYNKMIQHIVTKAAKAVAISGSIKQEFLSLGMAEDKIAIISNIIDVERFKNISAADLQNELHLASKTRVLLSVGRHSPKKGFELIPSIIEELLKVRDDFIWLIVGKGVKEKLKLNDRVSSHIKFLTQYAKSQECSCLFPNNELISLYKAADIFAFPTLIEGLGNVILEAMATGLPVITSNVPGCCDAITNGYNGILVEAGNVSKYAEEINNLLNNTGMANRFRLSGYSTVRQFSKVNVINKYYTLFKEILSDKDT